MDSMDKIVDGFAKLLIENRMPKKIDYIRLYDRINGLIDWHLRFKETREYDRQCMMGVMNAWEAVTKADFNEQKILRGIERATRRTIEGNSKKNL